MAKINHIVGYRVSLFTGVNGSEGWGYRLFFQKPDCEGKPRRWKPEKDTELWVDF